MRGEDVTEVGAIENVFESGEDFDPYWRAVCALEVAVGVLAHILQSWLRGDAYWHEKRNSSHVNIGKNGKKNCLVNGTTSVTINPVANIVFTSGPACSLMHIAKMSKTARKRYCASQNDH